MPIPDSHVCRVCKTAFAFVRPATGLGKAFGWGLVGLGLIATPLAPLLIPGVVIAVVSHRRDRARCTACRSKDVVPLETPEGQALTGRSPAHGASAVRDPSPAVGHEASR